METRVLLESLPSYRVVEDAYNSRRQTHWHLLYRTLDRPRGPAAALAIAHSVNPAGQARSYRRQQIIETNVPPAD